MTLPVTEHLHPAAIGLDTLPGARVLAHLLAAQGAALQVVATALPQIEAGAALMAQALQGGGRLVYAGAGSSALMAVADGLELGGTFGILADRVLLLMAGGLPVDARMPGDTEDDADEGRRAVAVLRACDVVIAVTASGRTPYALAVVEAARALDQAEGAVKPAVLIALGQGLDAALALLRATNGNLRAAIARA